MTATALRRAYRWALAHSGPTGAAALRRLVAVLRPWLPTWTPTGSQVDVPGPPAAPVVLLVAVGCDAARLRAAAAHVTAALDRGVALRPVWVVDCPHLDVLPADHVREYLPPPHDWPREMPVTHQQLRDRRLGRLRAAYRPGRVVTIPPHGPLPGREVLGVPAGRGAPRVLVVTTVHPPDDPRVRDRTVGALAAGRDLVVRYATRLPGPTHRHDHEWVPLRGGRAARMAAALRQALRHDVDVVSLHDPELIGVGLVVRAVRGVPVVLDVHEDLPARVLMRDGPTSLQRTLAARAVAWLLRRVEGPLEITLAEAGYRELFAGDPPVFPNHPLAGALPDPAPDGGELVYLGDVTEVRGAYVAVRAAAMMRDRRPLVMIGRCAPPLAARLAGAAARLDVELTLTGYLPHRQALQRVARASVGLCPLLDTPNYRHSLPTKVLEYLAVGVPVVASDLPGTATVIGGLPGVRLVTPESPAALAAALDASVGGPDREAAARHADAVRAAFTAPVGEVRAFYRSLAARAASR